MLLYEFEGKQLFKNVGISVPVSQLVSGSVGQKITIQAPLVLKAQTLSGKRVDAGGIVAVDRQPAVGDSIKKLFNTTVNGEKVERILVEEVVIHQLADDKEYYLSFSYSTETRGPVLTVGEGGTGVEEKGTKTYPIDILSTSDVGIPNEVKKLRLYLGGVISEELVDTALKLWEVFTKYDCELAEINPLVVVKGNPSTPSGRSGQNYVMALDAKIILDDDADFRREEKFPERNLFGRPPTEAEIEARIIDQGDHRGTAGSVYWELSGDIAVIAAGGGGSIVNMDALLAFGGKPANYTEHSGNPPREKLKKLTRIVLSKPSLKGCWFVGGTANFTDIYETLMGFVEGLREIDPKPTFPIVIRRGGPRDQEAFEALAEIGRKEGFNFHIFGRETPMTSTAKIMVDLAYGKRKLTL